MEFIGEQMQAVTALSQKQGQPLHAIEVDGALLTLDTISAITGRARTTLLRDEKAGLLRITRVSSKCSRVTSEHARAYLRALTEKGAA
jgi:hypothetical protein